MRESTGTITMVRIIIVVIFIFVAFLTLALSYSKAFRLKNEVVNIIEKYDGFSDASISVINNYLSSSAYSVKGSCSTGEYGVIDLSSSSYEIATSGKKYYYCVSKEANGKKYSYYNARIFFKFNLPILGDIFTFSITGQSKNVVANDTIKTKEEVI